MTAQAGTHRVSLKPGLVVRISLDAESAIPEVAHSLMAVFVRPNDWSRRSTTRPSRYGKQWTQTIKATKPGPQELILYLMESAKENPKFVVLHRSEIDVKDDPAEQIHRIKITSKQLEKALKEIAK